MSTTGPAEARPTVRQYVTPEGGYYEDASTGEGWVLFAAVILAMLAVLNMIDGIAAVSNSSFFVGDAKFILSGLHTWGWILIIMAVVQGLAAIGVWVRTPGVRWLGVAIAALNAIAQMFVFPAYPFWALMLFALDIIVIYGLVVHGSSHRGAVTTRRADAEAQRRAARGFCVGSACFAAASFVSQWASVSRAGIGVTFFAGSLFFTTAAARQYAHASGRGDRIASLVQLAGTLLFNLSTFLAMERHLSARQADLRVWAPDVFGSACFLAASAMAFAAVRRGARSRAWWIATLNLAGSLAFGAAAITSLVEPRDDQPVSAAITNATTTLGALCFLAGAVLLGRDPSVSSVSDDGRLRRRA